MKYIKLYFCSVAVKNVIILFQAAYYMTKPSVLQRHLSDTLKLNKDKCEAFVNAWISSAKGIVEHLRQRSLFPAQVVNKFFYTVTVN
jgi:hypothetical protein